MKDNIEFNLNIINSDEEIEDLSQELSIYKLIKNKSNKKIIMINMKNKRMII